MIVRRGHYGALLASAVLLAGCEAAPPAVSPLVAQEALSTAEFAGLVERISEPGGYFDTDNLISNERSYLHVVPDLREAGVAGGAYLGVGPEQNFSYIAAIDPEIAFIVDIRRDNALHKRRVSTRPVRR